MIFTIYRKAGAVLAKKPFRLWGISLLSMLLMDVFALLFGAIPGVALAIDLALITAMTTIYLRGYRGETLEVVDLFACMKDWQTVKRVLCGMSWMLMWIFLWALIPFAGIVFAVIKAYTYRLTPYILMYEPDIAPTQAIKVSEERTRGYRAKMFGADMLVIAVVYTALVILGLLAMIPEIGVFFALHAFLLFIVALVVLPLFAGLIQSAFYEEIMNERGLGARTETAAVPESTNAREEI